MAHIAMVLKGDIRYDGRVRKEIKTLQMSDHHVELIVSDFSREKGGNDLGIPIYYLPMKFFRHSIQNFLAQIIFNYKAAFLLKHIRPKHIHCHDLSALLAGVWAKRNCNARLVFDAHELFPESMGGIRKAIWNPIESYCIPFCDSIIIPEANRINYFKEKHPNSEKIVLLENFPREKDISINNPDLFRKKYPIRDDQKIVLHTGLVDPGRLVEEMIEAVCQTQESIILILLGRSFKGYKQFLLNKIRSLRLEKRVFIHEAVPYKKILEYMASADVGTAFYKNKNLNNYFCASNKLYEYIALKKPVLTNNYPGLSTVIEQNRLGICLEDTSPQSFSTAFQEAVSYNLTISSEKRFFWEDQEQALLSLYN